MTNRTYGNFIWRNSVVQQTSGTQTGVFQNNYLNTDSGAVTQGAHRFNMTTNGVALRVEGDFTIDGTGPGMIEGDT